MAEVTLSAPAKPNCPRCSGTGRVTLMMHPDDSPILGLCGCLGLNAYLILQEDDEWPEEIEVENGNIEA